MIWRPGTRECSLARVLGLFTTVTVVSALCYVAVVTRDFTAPMASVAIAALALKGVEKWRER